MKKIIFLSLFFAACASSPQFYPNEKLKSAGKDGAQKDTAECEAIADEYMTSGKGKEIAEGAGHGGIMGGAIGAVTGLFTGNVVRGAAIGAAAGGAGGAAGAALSPDQVKRNYINHCLQERGYKVMGWR